MSLPKIFVDGQEGTTGLKIHEQLAARTDIEILKIDADKRKDLAARKKFLNAADIVFLCLPDIASKESVALIDNPYTKVIDASTAFRTDPAWAYGLPELSPAHRQKIKSSSRIANPGCHATAFLLPLFPLLQAGIISPSAQLTCFSLTGYSGAGKKTIAAYESSTAPTSYHAPRPYALKLSHKHLPEMQQVAGLKHPPFFIPVIGHNHSGLSVQTFLPPSAFATPTSPEKIHSALAKYYAHEPFIRVMPFDLSAPQNLDEGCLDITACNNTNRADLFVFASPDSSQIALLTRLDNLGKGASGAAIQSMNLLLGVDETTALQI